MKEKEILQKIKDKEDRLLLAILLDRYRIYEKTGKSTYTNFLNERELAFLENMLTHLKIPYQVYWKDENLERNIIYFGKKERFVTIYHIPNLKVRHSDVMGSLYASGFSTFMIGDIIIQDEGIYLTNLEKYDFLLETSFQTIGKKIINLEKVEKLPKFTKKLEEIFLTVNSTRFDLIISHLGKMSRSKTLEYLKERRTFLNYKPVQNTSILLKEKDIFSVEKIGKFKIDSIKNDSKNKKLKILIKKYN